MSSSSSDEGPANKMGYLLKKKFCSNDFRAISSSHLIFQYFLALLLYHTRVLKFLPDDIVFCFHPTP